MDILAEKTAKVALILEQTMGIPQRKNPMAPLDNLMLTILSQNTNDRNRDKAYKDLTSRFPTWEDVMNADLKDLADSIRSAGLANQKSQRMQNILRWIYERYGILTLDVLCDMNPKEAIATFCQLKGIGIKTISVVLSFSCGVDIFPVDTHVHRLCNRIGLVKPQTPSAEKTFERMQDNVPKGKAYSFHINLINHGRRICKARKPLCGQCLLNSLCDYYTQNSMG